VNPRIAKIKDEIEKIKVKMNRGQIRLRELEKQLTDLENADIVAAVRGVEIAPDELAAFVKMFKEKQQGGTVPDLETSDAV
jgi:rubrerythrin